MATGEMHHRLGDLNKLPIFLRNAEIQSPFWQPPGECQAIESGADWRHTQAGSRLDGWTPKAYKEREIPIPAKLAASLKSWKTRANGCALVFRLPVATLSSTSWIVWRPSPSVRSWTRTTSG